MAIEHLTPYQYRPKVGEPAYVAFSIRVLPSLKADLLCLPKSLIRQALTDVADRYKAQHEEDSHGV